MNFELADLTKKELLLLYRSIGEEFRSRKVCRTSNHPVGELAEHLFSDAYGWRLEPNSKAGFDATDPDLGNIQIKARFLRKTTDSRQAGEFRNLTEGKFDWFAGLVFSPDGEIDLAFLAPFTAVYDGRLDIPSLNTSRIYLKHDWLKVDEVRDLTADIQRHWKHMNSKELV